MESWFRGQNLWHNKKEIAFLASGLTILSKLVMKYKKDIKQQEFISIAKRKKR